MSAYRREKEVAHSILELSNPPTWLQRLDVSYPKIATILRILLFGNLIERLYRTYFQADTYQSLCRRFAKLSQVWTLGHFSLSEAGFCREAMSDVLQKLATRVDKLVQNLQFSLPGVAEERRAKMIIETKRMITRSLLLIVQSKLLQSCQEVAGRDDREGRYKRVWDQCPPDIISRFNAISMKRLLTKPVHTGVQGGRSEEVLSPSFIRKAVEDAVEKGQYVLINHGEVRSCFDGCSGLNQSLFGQELASSMCNTDLRRKPAIDLASKIARRICANYFIGQWIFENLEVFETESMKYTGGIEKNSPLDLLMYRALIRQESDPIVYIATRIMMHSTVDEETAYKTLDQEIRKDSPDISAEDYPLKMKKIIDPHFQRVRKEFLNNQTIQLLQTLWNKRWRLNTPPS